MALVLMVLLLVLMILAWVLMVLALVMKVLTALALMLMILAQSYHIFTDGFWGYLQSKKNHWLTHSLNNIGLRDASASKNNCTIKRTWRWLPPKCSAVKLSKALTRYLSPGKTWKGHFISSLVSAVICYFQCARQCVGPHAHLSNKKKKKKEQTEKKKREIEGKEQKITMSLLLYTVIEWRSNFSSSEFFATNA